jgi:hypothetical protein
MFYSSENERVVSMVPGQGWRMVIALDPCLQETDEPKIVEEPVIAWAIVELKDRVDFGNSGEKIQQLAPLVRDSSAHGYVWEFSQWEDVGTVLLAPGEERTTDHDSAAVERQKVVAEQRAKKYARWEEARKLRREGLSFEAVAERLKMPPTHARALAMQVDEAMRREKR